MTSGAKRVANVQLSSIRAVLNKAKALEAQGRNVIHLGIGEPDFDTPPHIVAAAQQALSNGQTHYGPNRGLLALRESIAQKLATENNITANPEQDIIVTVGAAEALFMAMVGHLNPGDEVIVIEPAFINYVQIARMTSAIPVVVAAREENNWIVDPQDVQAAITERTRMLVINTPSNPTGAIIPQDVLLALGEIATKHNLLILADEIYEKIIYGDNRHVSIASLPGLDEHVITVNGYSKAYAMTGWRLAYVVAKPELIMPMLKVHQYTTTCAPTFAQFGAIAATTKSQDCVTDMVLEFQRRRDLVVNGLGKIPGITCVSPQGAFYAFPNISSFGLTSREFTDTVLQKTAVAMVPGTAFGACGEGYVRLSYANSYENIVEALERLQTVLSTKLT